MERKGEPDDYDIMVVFFDKWFFFTQEARNKNARDFINEFPEAREAIMANHYMDNYLGNADSLNEAKQLIKDPIFVHEQDGFSICNWIATRNF